LHRDIGVPKNCINWFATKVAAAAPQFKVSMLNAVLAAVPVVDAAMPAKPSAVMETMISSLPSAIRPPNGSLQ